MLQIILFVVCLCSPAQAVVPSFAEVKASWKRSELEVFDRYGVLINESRNQLKFRRLRWAPLSEISPAVKSAVIRSEDQRFFKHRGIDWVALTGSAGRFLLGQSGRGASTLSMQLVGMLDSHLRPKRKFRRVLRQKFEQMQAALELEKTWTKDQILEAYLNWVTFRGELQGVASASFGLFGKAPNGIDTAEGLVLAALLRSPNAPPEVVLKRACSLGQRIDPHYSCENLIALIQGRSLVPRAFSQRVALAPHVARFLNSSKPIHTTLNGRLQLQVTEVLRRQVLALRERNMNDAAALVVDNQSGEVLAYVGSVGDLSSAPEVDGVRAFRQAGSTLKPFIYGLAIEKKYLTAASYIDDSAIHISLGPGAIYQPQDFDHEYHGKNISVRVALASSLNIPAVRTLQLVGNTALVERLKYLGFTHLQSEEFYGPSLALGTADISLWELVNAYRTLANQGSWSELSWELGKVGKPRSAIMTPESVFIIGDILSDKLGRSLAFGMDTPLGLPFWSAVKTGTSKDMRDNWCVGYSHKYTVGVWTGNFSGKAMWNVSGLTGAAPAWAEIMEILHRKNRNVTPHAPRGVVQVAGEWYLRGTEPEGLPDSDKLFIAEKITYPVEGMVIAWDPDIPTTHQQIQFQTNQNQSLSKWILNNQEVGPIQPVFAWMPRKVGSYELKLVSASGVLLDEVRFIVK